MSVPRIPNASSTLISLLRGNLSQFDYRPLVESEAHPTPQVQDLRFKMPRAVIGPWHLCLRVPTSVALVGPPASPVRFSVRARFARTTPDPSSLPPSSSPFQFALSCNSPVPVRRYV